jgi:hypothetical protein
VEEALRILNKELMLYKEAQAEIARAKLAQQYPVQPIPPGSQPEQYWNPVWALETEQSISGPSYVQSTCNRES